jgi:hypothetical protein
MNVTNTKAISVLPEASSDEIREILCFLNCFQLFHKLTVFFT